MSLLCSNNRGGRKRSWWSKLPDWLTNLFFESNIPLDIGAGRGSRNRLGTTRTSLSLLPSACSLWKSGSSIPNPLAREKVTWGEGSKQVAYGSEDSLFRRRVRGGVDPLDRSQTVFLLHRRNQNLLIRRFSTEWKFNRPRHNLLNWQSMLYTQVSFHYLGKISLSGCYTICVVYYNVHPISLYVATPSAWFATSLCCYTICVVHYNIHPVPPLSCFSKLSFYSSYLK